MIRSDGWAQFRTREQRGDLPKIAYVPPFSGFEPTEKWLDVSRSVSRWGKDSRAVCYVTGQT